MNFSFLAKSGEKRCFHDPLSCMKFSDVIEQGSFARAAGVPASDALGHQPPISAMEEDGLRSVCPGKKSGVKLTGAGQQLYPYIQKIIAGK